MAVKLVTGHTGTNHVTSADAGALNASIVGTGKYAVGDNPFRLSIQDNTHVNIGTGAAFINGRYVRVDSPTTLEIGAGSQGTNRADRIVLRYSRASDGVESAALAVVKGTPQSGTPELPAVFSGSVLEGAENADLVLYEVSITGIELTGAVRVFETVQPISNASITTGTAKAPAKGTPGSIYVQII